MVRRGGGGGGRLSPASMNACLLANVLSKDFPCLRVLVVANPCGRRWRAMACSGDVCTPDTTHCHYQNIGRDVRAGKHFFKMFFSRLSFATPKYICELLVLRFLKAGVRGGLTTQFRFAHSRTG